MLYKILSTADIIKSVSHFESMDAGKYEDEELPAERFISTEIASSFSSSYPAASQDGTPASQETAGGGAECSAKNMWINEQGDLDLSEEDGAAEGAPGHEAGESGALGQEVGGGGTPGRGAAPPRSESSSDNDTSAHSSPRPRSTTHSHITSSHTSLEFSDDSTRSGSQTSKDSQGVRRGRFVLKPAEPEGTDTVSTMRYRKGRFQVTEALEPTVFDKPACKMIVSLLNMQNKQIDILFDMVKNISGDERLFHKEFTHLSNEVYELIGMLKKHTNA